MKSNSLVSAALSLLSAAAPAQAFWRMPCPGRLVTERADPIVSPGAISGHVHTISGGNGFNFSMDYAQARASTCSSCPITADLSNYWTPKLYYQTQNGSFIDVPQAGDGEGVYGGMTVYYLQRGGPNNDNLTAFPEGFRMLAGNPFKRELTNDFAGQAISFVCLDYDNGSSYYSQLPNKTCPDGVRAQVFFPSCWDGVNLDSADHMSHMAYPTEYSYDNGPCPASHPVHLISLFYEVIYSTIDFDWWVPEDGWQPFVFAMGDPTGYGFHGDFVNGWDVKVLQAATNTCLNDSGLIQDCDQFDFFTTQESQACIIPPSIDEAVTGTLDALPGCNPVEYTNAAPVTNCNVTSSIGAAQTYYINATGWTYLGCGTDNGSNRTLNSDAWWSNDVTVEGCMDYCKSKGYPYAGLEYSNQCFCGSTLPADRAPRAGYFGNCFSPCAGNSSEYCGGGNAMSIYYNNGTYSPVGHGETSIECPYSNNTTYQSANGTFTITCDIDRAGNDVGMEYVADLKVCMDTCANTTGCTAVSLSGYACYMHGGNQTPKTNTGISGAYISNSTVSSTVSSSSTTQTSTSSSSASTVSTIVKSSTTTTAVASATSTKTSTSTTLSTASSSSSSSLSTLSTLTSSTTIKTSTTSSSSAAAASTSVSCPGSNSTVYTASSGSTFLIECGIDHQGGDMGSLSTSTFAGCIEACANTTGCVDVSLSGSACYMKKTLGAAVYGNGGIRGAKLLSSAPASTATSTSTLSTASSSSSTTIATSVSTSTDSSSAVSSSVSSTLSTAASAVVSTSTTAAVRNNAASVSSSSSAGSSSSTASLTTLSTATATTTASSTFTTTTTSSTTTTLSTSTTPSSTSTSAIPSSTSASTSASSSTSSSASSSTSAMATTTAISCPSSNNTIFQDPTTTNQYVIECSIDHSGGDLAMTYVKNLAGCIAACSQTTGCVDVSLSGTACYMKSKLGTANANGGVNGARLIISSTTSSATSSTSTTATASATGAVTTTTSSQSSSTTTYTGSTVVVGYPLAQGTSTASS